MINVDDSIEHGDFEDFLNGGCGVSFNLGTMRDSQGNHATIHAAALEVCDNPFRPLKTEIGTWACSRTILVCKTIVTVGYP